MFLQLTRKQKTPPISRVARTRPRDNAVAPIKELEDPLDS